MRKVMISLVCLLSLLAVYPAQAIIIVAITPSNQIVAVGTPVNIALTISGLGDYTAPSLSTFDLDVNFDPTLLTFGSAAFGDPILGDQLDLTGLGTITDISNPAPGKVNLFELSFDSATDLDTLQAGNFTLATLSFNTLAGGVSPLTIVINALGDASGDPLTATASNGSVTIPDPTTLMLLMAGLFGMLGWNKKHLWV